jgi:hypothetical protein
MYHKFERYMNAHPKASPETAAKALKIGVLQAYGFMGRWKEGRS